MAGYTMSNGEMLFLLIVFFVVCGLIAIGLEHFVLWIAHHISLGWTK